MKIFFPDFSQTFSKKTSNFPDPLTNSQTFPDFPDRVESGNPGLLYNFWSLALV